MTLLATREEEEVVTELVVRQLVQDASQQELQKAKDGAFHRVVVSAW